MLLICLMYNTAGGRQCLLPGGSELHLIPWPHLQHVVTAAQGESAPPALEVIWAAGTAYVGHDVLQRPVAAIAGMRMEVCRQVIPTLATVAMQAPPRWPA